MVFSAIRRTRSNAPEQDSTSVLEPALSTHTEHVQYEGDTKDTEGSKKFFSDREMKDISRHIEATVVDEVYQRKVYILNKIMNEHVGMTWWQWGLLCVSGVGWLIDNAWLQLVAVILPQVQNEFLVQLGDPDPSGPNAKTYHPEMMTIALFAGLVVGAAFWGIAADIVGRRVSFNATLFIAGVFGLASGGATTFPALGGLLAALGFGLGGSLPVDGMLFLEFIPGNRQYLLAFLSVFWSLGQLMTSLIGWAFIANYKCDNAYEIVAPGAPLPENYCYPTNSRGWRQNNGWRYLNFTIGAFTLACFFLRFLVFKIPESPKFLLSKGRDAEAVAAMKKFAAMCGKPLPEDMLSVNILRSAAGQDVDMDDEETEPVQQEQQEKPERFEGKLMRLKHDIIKNARSVSFRETGANIKALYSTFAMGYTTTVIWILWAFIGLAYPLFNSFIILYLGSGLYSAGTSKTYRNYTIISACGIPGSIVATALVELPRSGRRGAMSIGTLLTGVFLFAFTTADTDTSSLAFSCVIAFTQNIMYGVLYCYTPESFPAPVRGSADGIGSSLNRIFGLIAPIIKTYSTNDPAAPIYVSGALFLFCGLLILTLRVETSARSAL
ncbi:hypothetical protein MVES1_001040 [Malassezia vespertilionis]|uniref:uncharacterized protein n=1 Tax=Malassezia vespertilionis TaxID=2020962 RepID=UPI0024B24520|nr:uncharacterized protein MVES1_001040 [Malassezia vespertilionis]WFD05707.1 hypothetical protein MVES1_001040 [Malassezia vespertilionis]